MGGSSLSARSLEMVSRELASALAAYQSEGPMSLAGYIEDFAQGQCPRVFYVPALPAYPFWDPWRALELASTQAALQAESAAILSEYNALSSTVQPQHVTDSAVEGDWHSYALLDNGEWIAPHCALCPRTMAVLREVPLCDCTLGCVYFSVLGPHTR